MVYGFTNNMIYKYVGSDNINLTELDILTRLSHPNLIQASIKTDPNGVFILMSPVQHMVVPSKLSTSHKLDLAYQVFCLIEFLHQAGYGNPNLSFGNLGLIDNRVVLLDVSSCIKYPNRILDIHNWVKFLLSLLLNSSITTINQTTVDLLTEYKAPIVKLINDINTLTSLNMEIIHQSELFNNLNHLEGGVLNSPTNTTFPSDHRDILKFMWSESKSIYPNQSVELLFLAVNMFKRLDNTKLTPDVRMLYAKSCLDLAFKLLSGKTNTLSLVELEILTLLKGRICCDNLFMAAVNNNELLRMFDDIILNSDVQVYNTDLQTFLGNQRKIGMKTLCCKDL